MIPRIQYASDAHQRRGLIRPLVHVSTYNNQLHVDLRWLDGTMDGNNAVLALLESGALPSADYVLWDSSRQYAAELDKPAAEIVQELKQLDVQVLRDRAATNAA